MFTMSENSPGQVEVGGLQRTPALFLVRQIVVVLVFFCFFLGGRVKHFTELKKGILLEVYAMYFKESFKESNALVKSADYEF